MQFKKSFFMVIFLLGSVYLFSTVVIDGPTITDQIGALYQKAQRLQAEFPELTKIYRCDEVHKSEQVPKLLCNFYTMWVKIKAVAKSPNTTSQSYVAALTSTLDIWELSWRFAQNEVLASKKG